MSAPCRHEHEDAAYVLGALAPDDRATFERHLPGCTACTRAVGELAGLPGLLARVPVDVADPPGEPTPVPDTLLPTLVGRVREHRRRRTVVTAALLGVAATVALAATGVSVGLLADRGDDADPAAAVAPAQPMRSLGDDPVAASISLTSVGWGTRLDLTCDERRDSATGPLPADWSSYAMYVHTRGGQVEKVATWQALPGHVVRVSGATATDRADIVDVDVRNAAGQTVLDLNN